MVFKTKRFTIELNEIKDSFYYNSTRGYLYYEHNNGELECINCCLNLIGETLDNYPYKRYFFFYDWLAKEIFYYWADKKYDTWRAVSYYDADSKIQTAMDKVCKMVDYDY